MFDAQSAMLLQKSFKYGKKNPPIQTCIYNQSINICLYIWVTDRQRTAETERKKLKFGMCVCISSKILRKTGKSGYYTYEVAGNS